MKSLEEKILRDGHILPGNILKVDNFLNHMIDPGIFMEMGQDFYDHFKDKKINKILTVEVSGIAIAFAAAIYFKVPVVFAKKTTSLTLGEDVYASKVFSYTKNKEYDIKVNKSFLLPEDRLLIIDDFLANGQALQGMFDLADQAGAKICGAGIAIEKAFQMGGEKLRQEGYEIYSQAIIERFEGDKVIFRQQD